MSFSNSVFALFASIQGMCNITRIFAMVRLGGSGSAMATVPAEKSVTYLYHLTCSVSRKEKNGIKIVGSALQL